jgi:hypothetical protein
VHLGAWLTDVTDLDAAGVETLGDVLDRLNLGVVDRMVGG